MIRFIDLFAGIGGIRLGFMHACQSLGYDAQCVLSSEIDEFACETYALNFGEYPQGDIHEIFDIENFDFLLAGFPCQPFSYAGKQKGFGDTRGTLFFEIERILKSHKPSAFLLENVRGLVSHDKGRTLKTIIEHLNDAGYGVQYILANSSDYGIPQNRMRIYIVGLWGATPKMSLFSSFGASDSHTFHKMYDAMTIFDNDCSTPRYVKDILEKNVDHKYYCSETFIQLLNKIVGDDFSKLNGVRMIDYRGGNSIHSWELGLKGECSVAEIDFMNKLISNRRKKHFGNEQDGKMLSLNQIKTFYKGNDIELLINSLLKKGYLKIMNDKYNPVCGNMSFEVFKFLDPESVSITLVSSDAHKLGIVQNNIPRRITPRECARLQGFPDSFIVHPKDLSAYKQFGNSVTVKVIEAVIKDLLLNNSNHFKQNHVNFSDRVHPPKPSAYGVV